MRSASRRHPAAFRLVAIAGGGTAATIIVPAPPGGVSDSVAPGLSLSPSLGISVYGKTPDGAMRPHMQAQSEAGHAARIAAIAKSFDIKF